MGLLHQGVGAHSVSVRPQRILVGIAQTERSGHSRERNNLDGALARVTSRDPPVKQYIEER
jgi:hypothetical protein